MRPPLTTSRYTSAKQYLIGSLGLADDVKTHAASSLLAGTMATTICAPADVLKSRLQSSAGQSVRCPVPL
jgi:dicarboxylate transporter 10